MSPAPASLPQNRVVALPGRGARARLVRIERQKPHRLRLLRKIHTTLEALEDIRLNLIARLDALDGDTDIELDESELEDSDSDQQCEDEGTLDNEDDDRSDWEEGADAEPDQFDLCAWRSGDVNQGGPGFMPNFYGAVAQYRDGAAF